MAMSGLDECHPTTESIGHILSPGIQREEPLLEVTKDAYDEVYRVNLKAAMFLAQATAGHQIDPGRGGQQVHLLSVRAQFGLRARGYSAYYSTKGDMVMLVGQHAMERNHGQRRGAHLRSHRDDPPRDGESRVSKPTSGADPTWENCRSQGCRWAGHVLLL